MSVGEDMNLAFELLPSQRSRRRQLSERHWAAVVVTYGQLLARGLALAPAWIEAAGYRRGPIGPADTSGRVVGHDGVHEGAQDGVQLVGALPSLAMRLDVPQVDRGDAGQLHQESLVFSGELAAVHPV